MDYKDMIGKTEKNGNITTIWYPDEADREEVEAMFGPDQITYETEVQLLDRPVFAVIPFKPCWNVILILERYNIPYQEQDEWSKEMMLHEIPRTVVYKGNKVKGTTIYSRVSQEEILRIAEEVEDLDPYEIAPREIREKVFPPFYPPHLHVIKMEINEETNIVTEYFEDGHTVTHLEPNM